MVSNQSTPSMSMIKARAHVNVAGSFANPLQEMFDSGKLKKDFALLERFHAFGSGAKFAENYYNNHVHLYKSGEGYEGRCEGVLR